MSGEFLQVNTALVAELKARGLWTPQVREAIKRAEGSVQGIAALPAEIRRLFRTAWELPQRALIDLAAARGAVHRPEPVAQPVPGRADHRQAVLDVPARLEGGPEDHLLPALAPGHPDPAGHRRGRRPAARGDRGTTRPSPAPWRTPRPARPASDRDRRRPRRPTHLLLDPGMDLTLRPMRYPTSTTGSATRSRTPGPSRRWTCTPTWPTWPGCRRPSGTWSPGWSRSSPPATRSSPTTWCSTSTSTSTPPRGGCTCPGSCSRRPCTCSST